MALAGERKNRAFKKNLYFWGASLQSSRVEDARVFKMAAESHHIYLKPTWRRATVTVSVWEGRNWYQSPLSNSFYNIIWKPFGMARWGLCQIDGSVHWFQQHINSTRLSFSPRWILSESKICRKQTGVGGLLASSCTQETLLERRFPAVSHRSRLWKHNADKDTRCVRPKYLLKQSDMCTEGNSHLAHGAQRS